MFEVVCIDAAGKPARIPQSAWPKEGETYTVIAEGDPEEGGGSYFLKEIGYEPYEVPGFNGVIAGYKKRRFARTSEVSLAKEDEVYDIHLDEIYSH